MDSYRWVLGELAITITEDLRMVAHTVNLKGMHTDRPRSFDDTFAGISLDETDQLKQTYISLLDRVPGKYRYCGYMGGAVAFLVRSSCLRLLPNTDHLSKLQEKYGPLGEAMMLTMARTTHGDSIWNCLEPSGGMARELSLEAERFGEGSDLGVYQPDVGWVRFVLPQHLLQCQPDLDVEQARRWEILKPGFPCRFEAAVQSLEYGSDELDGRKGVLLPGHIGEFNLTSVALLDLPGNNWCVCDTEARQGRDGEPDWVALDRVIWGITPRTDMPPMAYQFSRHGGLEYSGLHLPLVEDIVPYVISPNTTLPSLKALGWL